MQYIRKKILLALVLPGILFLAFIWVWGSWWYKQQENRLRASWLESLNSLAELKKNQITGWHQERIGDIQVFVNLSLINTYLEDQQFDNSEKAILTLYLNQIKKTYGYHNIQLLSKNGARLLSLDESAELGPTTLEYFHEVMQAGKVLFSSIHYSSSHQHEIIDLVAPVIIEKDGSKQAVGAVVFTINPKAFLYPLILYEPNPGSSMKTLLVQPQGEQLVVFASPAQGGEVHPVSVPSAGPGLPELLSGKDQTGGWEGRDFRGTPVLAVSKVVHGTPWFIVAQVEVAEMYQPLYREIKAISRLLLVIILFGSAVIAWWLSDQKKQSYQELLKLKEESGAAVAEEATWRRLLMEQSKDGIVVLDQNGKVLEANQSFAAMIRWPMEEIQQLHVWDWDTQWSREELLEMMRTDDEHGRHLETRHRRRDGTFYDAEISTNATFIGHQKLVFCVCRDVTERKQAERALQDQYQFLQLLIDTIPSPVFYKDANGIYQWCNQSLANLLGKPKAAIIGKGVFEVSPTPFAEKYYQMDQELLRHPGMQSYAHEVVSEDGTLHYFVFNKTTFIDSGGKVAGLIGVMSDITAQKRAEAVLQQKVKDLAALYMASEAFLTQTEVTETLTQACRLAVERFGLKLAWVGLISADNHVVQPAAAWGEATAYLEHIAVTWDADSPTGQVPSGRAIRSREAEVMNLVDADPGFVPWQQAALEFGMQSNAALPMLAGGEVLGILSLYSGEPDYFTPDWVPALQAFANQVAVAFQKARLYEASQHYTEELEKRVAKRTAELVAARDEAEAASRAKSDFLGVISHEFRTPLNAIIGFSELLEDQLFGPLNDKQARQVHNILTSGKQLLSLVTDILDLVEAMRGKTELLLAPVHLSEFIDSSLLMIREKATRHAIQLEVDLAPEVADLELMADERQLKQIMFNLLANAAKFTPDGGGITVKGKMADGNLQISVGDTGIGIPPEDRERIFRSFEQGDPSLNRQYEGAGLGLALTRRLVELHGGRIWVKDNNKGPGSVFTFTIPLQPAMAQGIENRE